RLAMKRVDLLGPVDPGEAGAQIERLEADANYFWWPTDWQLRTLGAALLKRPPTSLQPVDLRARSSHLARPCVIDDPVHARGETEEQRGAQRLVLRRSRDVVLLGQGAEELRELDRPYLLLLGASAAMTSARRFAPGRGDAAGAEPARRARARGRAPAVRPRW